MLTLATITAALALAAGGHPVSVVVNNEAPGSWDGSAFPGYPVVNIGRDALTDAESGGGRGLKILLHEVGHVTGITDEAQANCFALRNFGAVYRSLWADGLDPWAFALIEREAYHDAVASMLQQSAAYHCPRFISV